MKRMLMIMGIALLLVLLATQAAFAGDVLVTHDDVGTTVTVDQGDRVTFGFYWWAGTPGLVREVTRGSTVTMGLTGPGADAWSDPAESSESWGPVQRAPDLELPRASANANTPVSLAWWRMPLPTGELAAGEYVIHWTFELTHSTLDLGDWDGDGRIDHYAPSAMGGNVTLIVQ